MRLDPKLQHCKCGYTYRLSWYHYIKMLFQDITLRCPQCYTIHRYRLTYYVNEVWDNEVKRDNKQIFNKREELWRQP